MKSVGIYTLGCKVNTYESEFVENSGYSDNTAMMLIRSIRIRPCIRSILRFGIQIKCKGYAFIDGLSIKYRLLGGNN